MAIQTGRNEGAEKSVEQTVLTCGLWIARSRSQCGLFGRRTLFLPLMPFPNQRGFPAGWAFPGEKAEEGKDPRLPKALPFNASNFRIPTAGTARLRF
jgi:hypothetical protein